MKKRSISNSKVKRNPSVGRRKSVSSKPTCDNEVTDHQSINKEIPSSSAEFQTTVTLSNTSNTQTPTQSCASSKSIRATVNKEIPNTSADQSPVPLSNKKQTSNVPIHSNALSKITRTVEFSEAVTFWNDEQNGNSQFSEVDKNPSLSVYTPPAIYSTIGVDDDDLPATQILDNRVLKNVVAYVEVRSTNDNRSEAIRKELEQLGAEVVKKLTDDVTHVIFKEGSKRTKNKAVKNKIHLVSVLWVDSCKQYQEHVSEILYPAILPTTSKGTPLFMAKLKKAKSMQPSNFDDEVANSTERCIKRKKQFVEKLKSSDVTPQNSPNLGRILVQETQPRTPIDINTPIRLLIPDTPPSMREKMNQLKSKDSGTPLIDNEEEPLQRRLFAGLSNASFDTNDVDDMMDGLKDEINKCIENMPESPIPMSSSAKKLSCQSSPEKDTGPITSTAKPQSSPSIAQTKSSSSIAKARSSPKVAKLGSSISVKLKSKTSIAESRPCISVNKSQSCPSTVERDSCNTGSATASKKKSPKSKNRRKSVATIKFVEAELKPRRMSNRRKSVATFTPSKIMEEDFGTNEKLDQSISKGTKNIITEETITETSNKINVSENELPSSEKPQKSSLRGRRKSSIPSRKNSNVSKLQSEVVEINSASVLETNDNQTCKSRKSDTHYAVDCSVGELSSHTVTSSINLSDVPDKSVKKKPARTNSKKKLLPLSDLDPVNPLMSNTPDRITIVSKRKINSTGSADSNVSALFPKKSPGTVQKKSKKRSNIGKVDTSNQQDSSNRTSSTEITMTDDLTLQETTVNSSTATQNDNSMSAVFGDSVLSNISNRPRASMDEFNLNRGIKRMRRPKSVSVTSQRQSDSDSSDNCQAKKMYRRSPPSRPSLVMTSLHAEEQDVIISVVKKLGHFVISDNVTETTTHLICGGPRRTLNVLYGLMRGIWIVHKQWVLSSLEAHKWLPEENYEVTDYFPVVKVTREGRFLHKENYESLSLRGVGTIFIAQKTSPPRHHLLTLLKLCGGKVIQNINKADIYMGHEFIPHKTCVNPVWVLDCITQQQELDLDRYLLGRPKRESSPEF